ncbi:hypothetical protein N431DRAFT_434434 [Stipitochalara longipes BDJ]|nr:hypothetical protein N431DRAFT_434434 [Stipitochalara longipes BDJ]
MQKSWGARARHWLAAILAWCGVVRCGSAIGGQTDFLGWRDEWRLARGRVGGIGRLRFDGWWCDWLIGRMEGIMG